MPTRRRRAATGPPTEFHCATFYTEGPPHDKGLSLRPSVRILHAAFKPWCARFHSYSVRRVRSAQLRDGTPGSSYAREYSPVSGHLNYPNTGYNTIGFGAFKPFIILHVLERIAPGAYLYFSDCNVYKHWNLQAFPNLAEETTRWLLEAYGHEDVAMPRENPSMTHRYICSARALSAAERECGGRDLASLPSPHSNRIAVRNTARAVGLMRMWLNATQDDATYLPAPTRPGGRWHTPEQCSFGLIDGCRHGKDEVWFEYFYTRHHARHLDGGSYWRDGARPALVDDGEFIAVARTRSPTFHIAAEHRWGASLHAVAAALPTGIDGSVRKVVDACLVFPRLNDVRFTSINELQCPNVLYERQNETHWKFKASSDPTSDFKARPL